MPNNINFDQMRNHALARIEQTERNYKLAFFGAAAMEALFMLAFVLAADFHNRIHLLLLLSTVGGYTIIVLGLLALGAHVSRHSQLILRAIDLNDTPRR
jgi:hypothetical protein